MNNTIRALLAYPDLVADAAKEALARGDVHLALAHACELVRLGDGRGAELVAHAEEAIHQQAKQNRAGQTRGGVKQEIVSQFLGEV